MNQIASGGEISRVMLAIRTIFTEFDKHSLLILDEIDTGVSVLLQQKMAEKMKLLAGAGKAGACHLPSVPRRQRCLITTLCNERDTGSGQSRLLNISMRTLIFMKSQGCSAARM